MSKGSQDAITPPRRAHGLVDHLANGLASKARYWWLLLIAGVVWIAIGLAIPRFAYATVATLAIVVGAFCLVAAINEVMVGTMMSSRGGRIARWSLAVVFVVAGIVAFLGVHATIIGLSAAVSVLFVLWGAIGVLTALAAHRAHRWWVLLITSLIDLAIGLSIAGSLKGSIMTLLAWATAGTLVHGIGEIALAFLVRGIGRDVPARR
jgi:uncharacterized membrane protein HdeD (DUF308 family)